MENSNMKYIDIIYRSDYGIAFYWKEKRESGGKLAQIVFREMGFYLTLDEIKSFAYSVQYGLQQPCCEQCDTRNCRSLLLKTPSSKVDLAVSREELFQIQDLLDKTIIRMETQQYMATALN